MEILKVIFSWIGENILDIALVVVGASAFITYILQTKNERKTAAALIIEQINSTEVIIEDLKNTYLHSKTLEDNSVYLSREISYDGAWSSYKHLLIKQLSNSEFNLLQKFFNSAYQIEKTRSDIIYCFKLSWNNKSLVYQLINGKFNDPTYVIPNTNTGNAKNATQLIKEFVDANQSTLGFNPQIAYDGLYAELNNYTSLSGTTAYAKLLKIAGRK